MSVNILNYTETGSLLGKPPVARAGLGATSVGQLLTLWLYRRRIRCELMQLLERGNGFFKDIGVDRATIYAEAAKPFWRA